MSEKLARTWAFVCPVHGEVLYPRYVYNAETGAWVCPADGCHRHCRVQFFDSEASA